MSKIGIIGSGAVGKALAQGFLKYGYAVKIASRDSSKQADLEKEIGGAISSGDFAATGTFGEILVLAVRGDAAKHALELVGEEALKGKIVIDATNPIDKSGPVNGVLPYFTAQNGSLMEELQGLYPDTRFVKAFNSVGSAFMVNPQFEEGKPTMFICGNDNEAKGEVTAILFKFGWDVEDMGPVEAARAIEPLAMLWCIPGFRENRWSHAFKLLKK